MRSKINAKKKGMDSKIEELFNVGNIVVDTNSNREDIFEPFVSSLTKSTNIKELKFIFIDTETTVSAGKYDELEYSLYPVISNEYTAYRTLTWCVAEMNMRRREVRYGYSKNIEEYNKINKEIPLPYLVILISDTAKLLKGSYAKEIGIMLCRLSALGKELGIHLILFTSDSDITEEHFSQ